MRLKRNKQHRRTLRFFRLAFGFQEPFRVLVDGTFITHALQHKFHVKEQLPKLLEGRATPVITNCILAELRSLGSHALGAAIIAKGYYRVKCNHMEAVGAAQCMSEQIGSRNERKFAVATQDVEFAKLLRKVPGVPLIRLNGQVPVVEEPSAASRANAVAGEARKMGPSDWERPKLPALQEREASVMVAAAKPRKRRGPKGANPLSCRKPQMKHTQAASGPGIGATAPSTTELPLRKRRVRSHRMGKTIHVRSESGPTNEKVGVADGRLPVEDEGIAVARDAGGSSRTVSSVASESAGPRRLHAHSSCKRVRTTSV